MPRSYCSLCHRPQVSCICQLFALTDNDIHVVILQHPSEVKQSKGTVTLLSQSLKSCQVIIGEDFNIDAEFQELMLQFNNEVALLYPSEKAQVINEDKNAGEDSIFKNIRCIILLDGTWKKAFRLYMVNEILHTIPHFLLPDGIISKYQIRATKKEGALSTLEACCHALSLIEKSPEKYSTLLASFDEFNEMQKSFIPHQSD